MPETQPLTGGQCIDIFWFIDAMYRRNSARRVETGGWVETYVDFSDGSYVMMSNKMHYPYLRKLVSVNGDTVTTEYYRCIYNQTTNRLYWYYLKNNEDQ